MRGRRSAFAGLGSRTPALEWLAAALGLALVLFIASYLGYRGLTDGEGQPEPVAEPLGVTQVPGGFLQIVRIHNRGRQTAAQVALLARLEGPGSDGRERRITLDYVPRGSSREAAFLFTSDPRAARLSVEVEGFAFP